MTKELSLPCRYKVVLNSFRNSYHFSTDTDAEYEILFSPDADLFSNTDLKNAQVFMLVISKTRAGTGKRDPQIKKTVYAIVEHFFNVTDRILVYLFDNNDGRELTRKRLFETWMSQYEKDIIERRHSQVVTDEINYEVGIIFHSANPIGTKNILTSFESIVHVLSDK